MTLYLEKKPNGVDYLKNLNQEELNQKFEEIFNSIDQQTAKLLDILIIKQTESGFRSPTINLDIKEYATILNGGETPTRSQINKAREKAKKGIEALKHIKYTYSKGKTQQLNISLYGGTDAISQGKMFFKFNEDFFKLNFGIVNSSFLAVLPIKLLSIDSGRYPSAYLIGKKLWALRRINRGNAKRETIVKVKTIYDYALSLPRLETTKKKNEDIIKPFERSLDAIAETGLIKWNYDNVYIDKIENKKNLTYEDWLDASIIIEWCDEYNILDASIVEGKKERTAKKKSKK